MQFLSSHFIRFLLPIALFVVGVVLCMMLVPGEHAAVADQLFGFPDSDAPAHRMRPLILQALCFLPALVSLIYCLGGTMDRYIARQFAGIFGVCLSTLLSIWLLMDFANKVSDFGDSRNYLSTIRSFYLTRAPAVLLLLLPYSLLLALLYSLGKLSGSREIIAMIQAGRSVVRITLPLIVAGLVFSVFCLGLNYQWAPVAEAKADQILDESSGDIPMDASNVLYRNSADRRLWEIGGFPRDYQMGKPLRNVEITTTLADNTLESRLFAKEALWDRRDQSWIFQEPVIERFSRDGPPTFETLTQPLSISNWSETPWQLIKPGLTASELGIPDLNTWLKSNAFDSQFASANPYLTQWHYRLALPFSCLVTVLLATPLGIHFSRRGSGGGVFLAVALSAMMLLVSSISLALGEAGILRPVLAAWLPNISFALIGFYLFRRRISGRPIYHTLRQFVPGND